MPGMNGFEFIKKVKEIKPEVKIFFVTAFEINDVEFRRVLPSTRIDEFIQKPISLKQLNIMIQNHINEIIKATGIFVHHSNFTHHH
ncbi:MAG: response regulator, partial [Candidatus Nitrosopolaris sp.]